LLPNGKVLVAGGADGRNTLASAELYDPAIGTWTLTGNLPAARTTHQATLLPNGKVLVTGGYVGFSISTSCLLYDPASGTWATAPSLHIPRVNSSATLLPNGTVLLAGGYNGQFGSFNNVEAYNPATNSWTSTVKLPTPCFYHSATLLRNGKLLLAGGTFYSDALRDVELYDIGLEFDDSSRPQIARASYKKNLRLSGSLFQGLSPASGGNTQDSSSNYPVVQLRNIDSQQVTFLPVDPRKGWSNSSFTSLRSNNVPAGPSLVTVFTNGIPSESAYLVIPGGQQ
jgi:hypothetical protein